MKKFVLKTYNKSTLTWSVKQDEEGIHLVAKEDDGHEWYVFTVNSLSGKGNLVSNISLSTELPLDAAGRLILTKES